MIPAKKRGRHLYWTNFNLPNVLSKRKVQICQGNQEVKRLSEYYYPNKYTYFRPVYNFNTDEKGGTRYEVEAVQIINTLTNRKTVISREQGASGKIKSGLEAMNLDSLIEFLINKTGA